MKIPNLDFLVVASRRPAYVLAGIFCVAFLLYGQILHAPFVYDDHELLLDNPLIKNLNAPLKSWQDEGTKRVTLWTFAVNYRLAGEQTFGFHLVNVILHSLNAWFLYLLIRIFFQTPRLKNTFVSSDILALLSALIFLCHPLQTEAVSYIWQRTELLHAFFYFLTLLCYLQGRLGKGKGYFFLAALFFVLGFYSKGMIVSFPLLALLIEDALFDVPKGKRIFIRSIGIGIILLELLFWHIPPIDDFRSELLFWLMRTSGTMMTTEIYTQIEVIGRYVFLTVFPFYQNLDYSMTLIDTFWNVHIILWSVFIFFILGVGVWLWKKDRLIALGIFWFFITLLPSSLLGGRDPMAEHRLYFSLAGFALVAASILLIVFQRKNEYVWFAIVFIAVLSLLTVSRNHLWQSPRLLFEDTVRKSPNLSRPVVMLGMIYLEENRLDDAARMFQHAIRVDPNSAEAYNNLGLILFKTGRSMEAENMFEKAIEARANFAPAYVNLGYLVLKIGDDDRAEELFNKALSLGKKSSALRGLGNVALARGRFQDAKILLEKAKAWQ